jgi:hypothetical protein
VRAAAAALLVLTDAYYPGWRAWVDGRPAAIYPTNILFRGVFVGAGGHVVEFRYQPASFWVGAALSIAAALASIALLFRRGRCPTPPSPSAGVASPRVRLWMLAAFLFVLVVSGIGKHAAWSQAFPRFQSQHLAELE